jgi:hypothetical protein
MAVCHRYIWLVAGLGWRLIPLPGAALAEELAHVRLTSHDEPHIDVEANAPMQGDSVTFHLEGPLTNATVVAEPNRKYGATDINVSGMILLGCSRGQQFMAGYTSIVNGRLSTEMTLNCLFRPNSNFHIDITFPLHPLAVPSSSASGKPSFTVP